MMLDKSLFVDDAVQERLVELPDGGKHTLYFKQLPAVEFRKYYNSENSEDDDVKANSMSQLIVASLCEPDGKPALTLKQAQKLKPAAMNAIATVIMEVNGFGAKNG